MSAFAVGDLNNDGWPDLVVGSRVPGDIAIRYNLNGPDMTPLVGVPTLAGGPEGSTIVFDVFAVDPDGDTILDLAALGLPPGATFAATPDHSTGRFSWTPGFSDARPYPYVVVFQASNARSGFAQIAIVVTDVNRPPTANPGGPYTGVVSSNITFDGSGSSDPDGNPLSFLWDFGDGVSASGQSPVHAYGSIVGSPYAVTLGVTDGDLVDTGSTTATIVDVVPANVFYPLGINFILPQVLPTWVRVEPKDGSFDLNQVSVTSVSMSFSGGSIRTGCKGSVGGDLNHNGAREMRICFSQRDLKALFAGLPNGTNNVTVTVGGDLTTGGRFQGDVAVRVVKFSWLGAGSLASVSPNPLNPDATLTFVTTQPGSASAQMFNVQGRLVKTILSKQSVSPGVHEVRVDGRDDTGNPLASGVYFYRVESPDGVSKGALTVLK